MATKRMLLVLVLTGMAVVALAQQEADVDVSADDPTVDEAVDEAATEPTTVIDELSQAEIDAELARAEEVLDSTGEVKEFTGAKPVPADLPLALPSDF